MLKVEVILGLIASSIAIFAFFAKAIANIRRGQREERPRKESSPRREISSGE